MTSKGRNADHVEFNPAMLRWARQWRDKSLEEAAKRVKKTAEIIHKREEGKGAPTVSQARILADFYGRPFVEFFWDQPPHLRELSEMPDFRLYRDAANPKESRELAEVQHWAEEQRLL